MVHLAPRGSRIRPGFLVLALFALLHPLATAQTVEPERPDPLAEPWRVRHYEELVGRGLFDITEDRDGRLWFATGAGVAAYDGFEWKSWTIVEGLLDERITSILARSDGSVVAGSRSGFSRFADGRWEALLGQHEGAIWGAGESLEARDGALWACTIWGVVRIHGDQRTVYCTKAAAEALGRAEPGLECHIIPDELLPESPWRSGLGLHFRNVGDAWIITELAESGPARRAGLRVGDLVFAVRRVREEESPPGTVSFVVDYQTGDSPPAEVVVPSETIDEATHNFRVTSLAEDENGDIYLGLRTGGVIRCRRSDRPEGEFTSILPANEKGSSMCLRAASDGSLWALSGGDASPHRIEGAKAEEVAGPAGVSLLDVAEGSYGVLWALSNESLYSRRGSQWMAHAPLPNMGAVAVLHEAADGMLWVGDERGHVARVETGQERFESFQDRRFVCRTTDGREWFVSRSGGLIERHDGRWSWIETEKLLGCEVTDALALRDGGLLVYGAPEQGVAILRRGESGWKREDVPYLATVGPGLNALVEGSDGSLWFGPGRDEKSRMGLLLNRGKGWERITSPLVQGATRSLLAVNEGLAWLGTSRGIYRCDGHEIFVEDLPWGRPGTGVAALCLDREGRVWLGSTARGLHLREGESWTRFFSEDRPRNHIMDLVSGGDGSLWAATDSGLCRLDGEVLRLVVPWLRTDGVSLRTSSDGTLWIREPGKTVHYQPDPVPPETRIVDPVSSSLQQGRTRLSWVGRDPWQARPEEGLTFSFRRDGGEWSPFTDESEHVFENLSAGEHRIEVRARDRDFNVDPTPATIDLEVVEPVWRRPWFLALLAVFLSTLAFQAGRMVRRERHLRESTARAEVAEAAKLQIEREVNARVEAEEARRALETEMIQSRKMEAIGQLAGGVAHDFNNILTAIWGNASELTHLLENSPYRDPQAMLALDGIHTAADRAAALTRQLLMVGRRQVARPEVLDPNEILRHMSTMLQRVIEEDVRLDLVLGPDSTPIRVDRSMFEQVVMNLVVNARDAMPNGGRLEVQTSAVDLDQAAVAPHPGCEPGPYLRLGVRDEGEGMTEETMARIFEPFFTTKPTGKGTGLGLSTVFAIARQCNGFVTVASTPGQGSCFEVFLPASKKGAEAFESEAKVPEEPRGAETVLVCEDDHAVREFVFRALERRGYGVLTACTGDEALELSNSYDGNVELLLTDVIMPGMNGRELAESICERRAEIGVLYMSGHAAEVLAHRSELGPNIDLLIKPFTARTLLERVREALDGR